ncbi:hypothetical protein KP509_23G007100 [Ceratopteris richardii]|nr:hypothetical protein KP509_23G007100 [Ceratopteris richardii]
MSLGDDLVIALAKCGALHDAHELLCGISHRTVYCWTAVISGYAEIGRGQDALSLYSDMQTDSIEPDEYTYVALFKACGGIPDLGMGRYLHNLAVKQGYASVIFLGNTLIRMYGKCRSVKEAENVFSNLPQQDVVSWNAMLSVLVENQLEERSLRLYRQLMEVQSVDPDTITFVCAIQACSALAKVNEKNILSLIKIGQSLHADMWRKGITSDVYIASALQTMYGKFGMVQEAEKVFDNVSNRNIVTWNAMLSAYVEGGEGKKALQLYSHMLRGSEKPNHQTFVIALQACSVLTEREVAFAIEAQTVKFVPLKIGQTLHEDARMIKGFTSNHFLQNALVGMYGRCGSLGEAETVFESSSNCEAVSCNAMLSVYVEQGLGFRALKLYRQLQEEGAQLDGLTFVIALQACGALAENEGSVFAKGDMVRDIALEIGCSLHADARRKGFSSHIFFVNTLISMYGKCGSIIKAEGVFIALSERNTVTWNAMLSAYVDQDEGTKVLQLYILMLEEGQSPNKLTYVLVLQACGTLVESDEDFSQMTSLEISRALHDVVKHKGLTSDVCIGCTLISMYGKCGTLEAAESVFNEMPVQNIVPWNALLSAYVEQEQGDKVLDLFIGMQAVDVTMSNITLLCVLQACGAMGCLEMAQNVHFSIVCTGDLCPITMNTIIFAYRSCAGITDALAVFNGLYEHSVVSWNACIAGYAHEGNCDASVEFFERMQMAGSKPDEVTSLSLLTAYSHAGLVDEGLELFGSLTSVGITPDLKHYSIIIDLFGRAGALKVVEGIAQRIAMRANHSTWLSVLAACRTHGNMMLGEYAFDQAVQAHPMDAAQYVLMSNIYSDAGLEQQAKELKISTFSNTNLQVSDWLSIEDEEA